MKQKDSGDKMVYCDQSIITIKIFRWNIVIFFLSHLIQCSNFTLLVSTKEEMSCLEHKSYLHMNFNSNDLHLLGRPVEISWPLGHVWWRPPPQLQGCPSKSNLSLFFAALSFSRQAPHHAESVPVWLSPRLSVLLRRQCRQRSSRERAERPGLPVAAPHASLSLMLHSPRQENEAEGCLMWLLEVLQ